jgi:hypothetical protein
MSDTLPDVTRHADTAYEATRAMTHLTTSASISSPTLYEVLGNLKATSAMQPQLFNQLAGALSKFQEQFEVFEDDGGDPAQRTTEVKEHLMLAAHLADQLANELEAAQQKIARQSFRAKRS